MDALPRALLLDLDGTLLDSEPSYKRTEAAVLLELGVDASEAELDGYTGTPLAAWLRRVEERHGVTVPPEAFLARHRPVMEAEVAERIALFPDTVALLDRFPGPVALVTSSMRWYVEAVFARHPALAARFGAVVTADDVHRGKPDPEPFLLGARLLGVAPSECLAVEDSANGVTAAVAAGCHTVAIDRDGRHDLSHAHQVFDTLDRVLG